MRNYRIAVIPGDCIGKEVLPEGQKVLEAASRDGFSIDWVHFDWSCERFTKTGSMMPKDGLDHERVAGPVPFSGQRPFRPQTPRG